MQFWKPMQRFDPTKPVAVQRERGWIPMVVPTIVPTSVAMPVVAVQEGVSLRSLFPSAGVEAKNTEVPFRLGLSIPERPATAKPASVSSMRSASTATDSVSTDAMSAVPSRPAVETPSYVDPLVPLFQTDPELSSAALGMSGQDFFRKDSVYVLMFPFCFFRSFFSPFLFSRISSNQVGRWGSSVAFFGECGSGIS